MEGERRGTGGQVVGEGGGKLWGEGRVYICVAVFNTYMSRNVLSSVRLAVM